MRRRTLLVAAGAGLTLPHALFAQGNRVFRIALLDDGVESARAASWELFRGRLRELVLKDGNDLAYEARYARGDLRALPRLAAQLVELKPDLIVTQGTPPTSAAQKATSTIPVLFIGAGDPVGAGLVATLARPGANVTGVSVPTPDISLKHLELVREIAPRAKRVAFLTVTSNKTAAAVAKQVQDRARAAGIAVEVFDASQPAALERSFEAMKKNRTQAIIVGLSTLLLEHRDPIAQFAAREKIPTVFGRPEFVRAGGLLFYGHDAQMPPRRAAEYAHRILNGASPADLAVEQITPTRAILNLKTAKSLGIRISPSMRARADEVIE